MVPTWIERRALAQPRLLAVFALATVPMELSATACSLMLTNQFGLASRPEYLTAFYTVLFAVSSLRPLYAFWIDWTVAFNLSRRFHAAAANACAALLTLASAFAASAGSLVALTVAANVAQAYAETATDGLLVRQACGHRRKAGLMQAEAFATRTLGSLLSATGVTACLALDSPPQRMLALAAMCPAIGAVVVYGVVETNHRPSPSATVDSDIAAPLAPFSERLAHLLKGQRGWHLLVAISMAVAATLLPTASDTYAAFLYSGAIPKWALGARQELSMAGSLLGALTYRKLALGPRSAFCSGAAVWALAGALSAVVASQPQILSLGVCEAFLGGFGMAYGYLPIPAIAAAASPAGTETLAFSMVIGAADVSGLASAAASAALVRAWRIGAPPDRSWAHLPRLILLGSLGKLAPIILAALSLGLTGDWGLGGGVGNDAAASARSGPSSDDDDGCNPSEMPLLLSGVNHPC
mmetsp:Transcript_23049/g.75141  ORF Transcript_23049/g.75141 Transcript_23049/m.75141 type:complete len:469 (+) Transcript_23049:189-1595(+)